MTYDIKPWIMAAHYYHYTWYPIDVIPGLGMHYSPVNSIRGLLLRIRVSLFGLGRIAAATSLNLFPPRFDTVSYNDRLGLLPDSLSFPRDLSFQSSSSHSFYCTTHLRYVYEEFIRYTVIPFVWLSCTLACWVEIVKRTCHQIFISF